MSQVAALADEELGVDASLAVKLVAANQRVRPSEADVPWAKDLGRARERVWEHLEGVLNESRDLAAAWDSAGPEECLIRGAVVKPILG